jgi:Pyruvate/2-oxoacid:ferredoxin oxidoreductase delta subunit
MSQKDTWDTISCLHCPDCLTPCPVRLVLLSGDGRLVYITTCGHCADHASVRCFKEVPFETFREAHRYGLPIVNYVQSGG